MHDDRLGRRLLVVPAMLLLAVAALSLWRSVRETAGSDFYMYYVAGNRHDRASGVDIYASEYRHRIGEEELARAIDSGSVMHHAAASHARTPDMVSSPFLYTAAVWLPRNFERALAHFRAWQMASFAAAVLMLGATARLPWTASLLFTAALLRFFHPLLADVIVGNVNSFQLAGLAVFISVAGRFPKAGAAVFGLLLAFKPTIVYVFLLLLIARLASRDWRRLRAELAGGAAGLLAAFTAAAINFGAPRVWLDWLPAAEAFYTRLPGREWNNVSPALPLYERWGPGLSLAVAATLLVCAAWVVIRRRGARDLHLVSAGVLIYLLSAPVVWMHYIVLAIVPSIALLENRRTAALGVAAMTAISYRALIGFDAGLQPLPQYAVTMALGVELAAVLFLIATCETSRRPLGRPDRFYR